MSLKELKSKYDSVQTTSVKLSVLSANNVDETENTGLAWESTYARYSQFVEQCSEFKMEDNLGAIKTTSDLEKYFPESDKFSLTLLSLTSTVVNGHPKVTCGANFKSDFGIKYSGQLALIQSKDGTVDVVLVGSTSSGNISGFSEKACKKMTNSLRLKDGVN